ncbi:hypothetical protein PR202_gb04354 [Eleusine coracana subsp. coracana]|uniref:Exocyst subunit Exo70 family protein n=1 Tax=Eleusine coracana subsp. coracana TaxID=191504 RepID=A0AAV5E3N9_ELECO|nr:hypothetical protein QOZ80_1BG0088450 [Eleusine coracana subsp. coracana]GJN17297.1 hypothetical protein PR202_gb04354 [Eleusine coracana subsp. coracana]
MLLRNSTEDHGLLENFDILLERCSSRLEYEFKHLIATSGFDDSDGYTIKKNSSHNDGSDKHTQVALPITNFDIIVDTLSEGIIIEANRIARRMFAAGFGKKCTEAYASARRNFIDESIARLGVHAHMTEMFKSASWEELETHIMRWIPATRVVSCILIPSESYLCNCIFEGFVSYNNLAVATACKPFFQLLSFAKFIAATGKSPECLFRIVDMYDALTDVLRVLDEAFHHEVFIFRECLGISIKGIFMALENLIRRDPSGSSPSDGGVHPLTRYVMNYLMAACVSRRTLEEVMLLEFDCSKTCLVDPDRPTSSLAVRFAWIVDVLMGNLESKSKVYGHAPLSCIFLINNGIYMIKKVNGCELNVLLGEDWVRVISVKVHQWVLEYSQATWGRAIRILEMHERPSSLNTMINKLNHFNNFVEAICQVQSQWVLVEKQQAVDLSTMVQELVIPVYRNTVGMLQATRAGTDSYLQPEDVKLQIEQLFRAMVKS